MYVLYELFTTEHFCYSKVKDCCKLFISTTLFHNFIKRQVPTIQVLAIQYQPIKLLLLLTQQHITALQ